MSNPTSNFGWQMPTPTDLVTDLPADFEVFGQAVDTDFVDLLGGTTGQVLAKASNADLDFVWSADAAGMTNPMTTTGDIIYASSGSTPGRIGIGSTGNVLTVAAGVPTWSAPAGGGKVLQVVSATSTTNVNITTDTLTDSGVTATITPTLNTSKILVIMTPTQQLFRLTVDANVLIGGCVLRGATKILDYDVVGTGYQGGIEVGTTSTVVRLNQHPAFTILDAPATTSATTYKLQARAASGSTSFQVNGAPSVITLLEIGA